MIFTFSRAVIWAEKNGQLFLMIASSQAMVKVFFSTLLDICLVGKCKHFVSCVFFLIPIGKGIMWVKPYANHLNI